MRCRKQELANLFLFLLSACPCPSTKSAPQNARQVLSTPLLKVFSSESPVTGLLSQDRKQVAELQRILPSRGRKPEDHFRALVEFDGKRGISP
jgi:hypothetical protein